MTLVPGRATGGSPGQDRPPAVVERSPPPAAKGKALPFGSRRRTGPLLCARGSDQAAGSEGPRAPTRTPAGNPGAPESRPAALLAVPVQARCSPSSRLVRPARRRSRYCARTHASRRWRPRSRPVEEPGPHRRLGPARPGATRKVPRESGAAKKVAIRFPCGKFGGCRGHPSGGTNEEAREVSP